MTMSLDDFVHLREEEAIAHDFSLEMKNKTGAGADESVLAVDIYSKLFSSFYNTEGKKASDMLNDYLTGDTMITWSNPIINKFYKEYDNYKLNCHERKSYRHLTPNNKVDVTDILMRNGQIDYGDETHQDLANSVDEKAKEQYSYKFLDKNGKPYFYDISNYNVLGNFILSPGIGHHLSLNVDRAKYCGDCYTSFLNVLKDFYRASDKKAFAEEETSENGLPKLKEDIYKHWDNYFGNKEIFKNGFNSFIDVNFLNPFTEGTEKDGLYKIVDLYKDSDTFKDYVHEFCQRIDERSSLMFNELKKIANTNK